MDNRKIFFPELMQEFLFESKKLKAEILYHKCIRLGKHSLAQKIKKKYSINVHLSDSVLATAYVIHYSSNPNKNA